MSRWTAFLVFSCFFRPLCSGYWQVRRGCQFLPMFPLCFSQIQSSSSWSGERSCGNPDLLMISSFSCIVPPSWPKWHACRWSLTSPLHSESFINLAEDSLQTKASLFRKSTCMPYYTCKPSRKKKRISGFTRSGWCGPLLCAIEQSFSFKFQILAPKLRHIDLQVEFYDWFLKRMQLQSKVSTGH